MREKTLIKPPPVGAKDTVSEQKGTVLGEVEWARRRRNRAIKYIIIPFVIAFIISAGIRILRTWDAATVIMGVSTQIKNVKNTGADEPSRV
jgi:hypothetical protein